MKPSLLPVEILFIGLLAAFLLGAYFDNLDQKQQECWQRNGELVEGVCSVEAEASHNPVHPIKRKSNHVK